MIEYRLYGANATYDNNGYGNNENSVTSYNLNIPYTWALPKMQYQPQPFHPFVIPPTEIPSSPASKINKIEHLLQKKDVDLRPPIVPEQPAQNQLPKQVKKSDKFRRITRSQTRTSPQQPVMFKPFESCYSNPQNTTRKRNRVQLDDAITNNAKKMRVSSAEEHSHEYYYEAELTQESSAEYTQSPLAESGERTPTPLKEIEIFLDDESSEEFIIKADPELSKNGVVKELIIEIPDEDEEFSLHLP